MKDMDKYNEALERAKAAYGTGAYDDATLEFLFPQLCESEEETTRKELLDFVRSFWADHKDKLPQARRWVTYLEKQKEPRDYRKLYEEVVNSDWFKQNYVGKSLGEEQKPAEWSKNDTAFLNDITDFFENKTVRLQHDLDMYAHWLKSLPERFVPQPKPEWSMEDECRREGIIQWLREYQKKFNPEYDSLSIESIESLISWLKSLRPTHWKPSEYHLSALLAVLNDPDNIGSQTCQLALTDLYEQLKKLM